ncbi:MAG: hypothetical protein ACHQ1H_11505 [Nitrososphaerales archaeon]
MRTSGSAYTAQTDHDRPCGSRKKDWWGVKNEQDTNERKDATREKQILEGGKR